MRSGFFEFAGGKESVGEVVVGFRKIGVQADRFAEGGGGFGEAGCGAEGYAEVVFGFGEVWVELNGAGVGSDGEGELAEGFWTRPRVSKKGAAGFSSIARVMRGMAF